MVRLLFTNRSIQAHKKIETVVCLSMPRADPGMGVGAGGPDPPLKNHKNIGFPSNIGPDPLKITKLPSQHSMLGQHRHASETPFKWRFAGGPMVTRL